MPLFLLGGALLAGAFGVKIISDELEDTFTRTVPAALVIGVVGYMLWQTAKGR